MDKRNSLRLLLAIVGFLFLPFAHAETDQRAAALISTARAQIGVTRIYDGAYKWIPYPNGDITPERGVCSDVIIRAYRQAFGHDLQQEIHQDMEKSFSTYPHHWGLKTTDTNIDHRRVPNLQTFFTRRGAKLHHSARNDYRPGDLVTQTVAGRLPHIVIVSDKRSADRQRYLVIHNIGAGVQEEDSLFEFPVTGHYRYFP
ncbi:DUF1287 domain-containing protein [Betaproteobacteria bacterium]|nr:DUF1287 domain-containing protein [Betaproteobacteria bacterium]GHU03792.1 DUF1287 domain-containing protein [Betaproteobacteria bacterium]GHU24612.1 DUF1287 domain-containing protein [Betaproteobacteria bacterium]